MTAPTSELPTPKLRANTGSTGTSTPNPTATQKAIRPEDQHVAGEGGPGADPSRTALSLTHRPVCRSLALAPSVPYRSRRRGALRSYLVRGRRTSRSGAMRRGGVR